ncbi:MAG: 50S ribosomal protein L15e [Candidatus Micrarchaeota archaeon]
MGSYKYIEKTLQQQYKERDSRYKDKLIGWRKEPVMVKVERPANLTRARRLGYKAKQGYIIVRVRVDKGRRTRRKPSGGRKPKSNYLFVPPGKSHKAIAETRVNRQYRNMEVLNSYWVGEDGNHKFFEVILIDSSKPSVNISAGVRQGKTFRGLTSSGRRGRPTKKEGLNKKLRKKKLLGKPPAKPYEKKEKTKAKATIRKRGVKAAKAKKKAEKRAAKKSAPKAEKKEATE